MEQIKLENGNQYYLPANAVINLGNEKVQITILPGDKTFLEIESDFSNSNSRIEILDNLGETIDVKKGYTYLESIKKQNDYVVGQEETINDDGELTYQDTTGTVYIIVLSKPDLREQVKNLQETVDFLVMEGLGA